MIFFVLILAMILIAKAKVANENQYMDYMSRDTTNTIKGVFTVLILLSHAAPYIAMTGAYDEPYMELREYLHQMVVVMFFFYSGYGMMKAILSKKFDYIRTMPVKRFLVVFLNFDIAVLLFLVVQYVCGTTFDIVTILKALIGVESIGNSNWYMFAIFVLYILMFVSFYMLRWLDNKVVYYVATAIFTILTMAVVLWEIRIGKPHWEYDTMILMPVGCWFALLQKPFEKLVKRNDICYGIVCAIVLCIYHVAYSNRWDYGIEGYTVYAIAFAFVVLLFTMKISFESKILKWIGEHLFSMYILQRIPMIILTKLNLASTNKYAFIVLVFLFTVVLAMIFDYFTGKLNRMITKRVK